MSKERVPRSESDSAPIPWVSNSCAGVLTNYTYDGAGNLILLNAPTGSGESNTHDDKNRRVQVVTTSPLRVRTFKYNGDGMRHERVASSLTTRYVWGDGDRNRLR